MTIIWQKSLSLFFWKCQCRRRVATIESKFIFNSSNVKSKTNFAILRMKTTQNKVSFKNNCFPLISFLWKEKWIHYGIKQNQWEHQKLQITFSTDKNNASNRDIFIPFRVSFWWIFESKQNDAFHWLLESDWYLPNFLSVDFPAFSLYFSYSENSYVMESLENRRFFVIN